jgi:hypothetical protein
VSARSITAAARRRLDEGRSMFAVFAVPLRENDV